MENLALALRRYTVVIVAASLSLGLWVAHQAITQAISAPAEHAVPAR